MTYIMQAAQISLLSLISFNKSFNHKKSNKKIRKSNKQFDKDFLIRESNKKAECGGLPCSLVRRTFFQASFGLQNNFERLMIGRLHDQPICLLNTVIPYATHCASRETICQLEFIEPKTEVFIQECSLRRIPQRRAQSGWQVEVETRRKLP